MTATESREPRSPQPLWLVRSALCATLFLTTALIGVVWLPFLMGDATSPAALLGLLCGTVAAMIAGLLIRHAVLGLAEREQDATRDAGHDLLSGLANRKLFRAWIDYELARHLRDQSCFAVMYLDIDHFKDVNDRYGHDAGDRMIVGVGKRIAATLRPTDRLARFGGDEFAILQTNVRSIADAEALAHRILDVMRHPFNLGALEMGASVSIGIALCPENAAERDDLMKLADLALYRAKREGRSRMAFFDSRMESELARRRDFGAELGEAIGAQALEVVFQPIFAADDGRIVAVDVRLRWPHPQRGVIGFDECMAVAEDRGLLLPLGAYLLRAACAAAMAWDAAGAHVRLCAPLAAVQFNHRGFAAQVKQILDDTGLDPQRLDLGLREDCILAPKADAVAGMTLLRREGVRFSLMDYGAGVVSLNHARRFPFTRIRLDRGWADFTPSMAPEAAVLHSDIHLGRALGLVMAATGVETPQQARDLAALGCQELQGPLLCREIDAADVQRLIQSTAKSQAG